MAFSLQEALEQIRSDKIKSRQQGLEALEFIFSDTDNVLNLDPKQEGRAWLKTFQALFECVLAEKAACIRKGSFDDAQSVAIARLQRAAQMLRSLVEKAAFLLHRKVVKALIAHILQMLNHRGSLLKPIAPAYIPALCAILKHQHHVDHLEPEDWWEAACLCFDVLLGREFNPSTDPSSAAGWLASIPSSPLRCAPKRSLSLEDAATADCLRYLMGCTVAPVLGSDGRGVQLLANYTQLLLAYPFESSAHLPTVTGLVVLLEHLELNSTLDVIHAALALRSSLLALWKTKNHLLKVQLLLYFRIVVPLLASYAANRTEIAPTGSAAILSSVQSDAHAFLKLIHDTLIHDSETRWALEPLRMDSVVFRSPQTEEQKSQGHRLEPLSNSAFSLGPCSNQQDTIAWCRIDLEADLVEALAFLDTQCEDERMTALPDHESARDDVLASTAGSGITSSRAHGRTGKRTPDSAPSSPSKKRRMEVAECSGKRLWARKVIGTISNKEASPSSSSHSRLCALQLLAFLVATRPSLLDTEFIAEARSVLLAVAAESDSTLASWSFVALAAMELTYDKEDGISPGCDSGPHIWAVSARKLPLPDTCRAAAFLLSSMLAKESLPESTLQSEIPRLLAEVDLQGPPVMCDSVCHLMTLLLHRTTSVRMYQHLDPRRKIGGWFSNNFVPADAFHSASLSGGNRSSAPFTPYHDLHRLVISVITESTPRPADYEQIASIAVSNDIADFLRRRARLQPLRGLVLNHKSADGPFATTRDRRYAAMSAESENNLLSEEAFHRMTLVLEKKVDRCLDTLNALAPASGVPFRGAIAALYLAVLTVDVLSRSSSNGHSQRISRLRICCQVIVNVIDGVSLSRAMSAHEYGLVMQQFELLAVPISLKRVNGTEATGLLLSARSARGIVSHATGIASFGDGQEQTDVIIGDDASQRIWSAIRECSMLDPIISCCERLLERALFGDEEVEPEASSAAVPSARDGFDDPRETGSPSSHRPNATPAGLPPRPIGEVVSVALRVLCGAPRVLTGSADPRHDEHIVSLFFDCSVDALVALSPVFFESIRCNLLWISQRDLVDALDRIGAELMTTYTLARDPKARTAAIDAVSVAVPLLLKDADEQSDLFDKVQKLAIFFSDQIGRTKWPTPWEVQMACAEFLSQCLHSDPEGLLCRLGSARGTTFSPTKALMQLNADPDIRVRGMGSAIAATIFNAASVDRPDALEVYATFRELLPSDSSIPQYILTRALSLSNVAIASSSVRQSSLFHLLEIVLATGMFPITIQQLFAQVAHRLGFVDASSCYQTFAGQITWGMTINGYDPLQVPWKVLGFASKRECLEATFPACGSMLLAAQTDEGRMQFDTLVQLTKRTTQQGLQECLPFLTAAYLGFAIQTDLESNSLDLRSICQRTLHDISQLGFSRCEDYNALQQMMINADDMIVTTLLSLYYDEGQSLIESRQSAVKVLAKQNAEAGKTLSALTPTSNATSCVLHEPSRPFFSAEVICTALSALLHLGIEGFKIDVSYNVLRHLSHRIASSKFVNEQLRLCAALRMYISMCGDAFWSDQLNASLLINIIEQLLDQHHLHEELRPFLTYACSHSVLPQKAPEILVSCIVAWSVELNEQLARSAQVGDWLLQAAHAAAKTAHVATSAIALLWPVQFTSREYITIEGLVDIGTLVFAIEACPRMPLQLPALLRIRAVLRKANKAELESFSKSSAWKLLQRMAERRAVESTRISADTRSDVMNDIFAILMSVGETASLQRERNLIAAEDKTTAEHLLETVDTSQSRSMSAAIVLAIYQLVQDLPLDQTYMAFEALRSIAATSNGSLTDLHPTRIPAMAKEELERVRPGMNTAVSTTSAFTLDDLVAPAMLEAANSSATWIRSLTASLCGLLFEKQQQSIFAAVRVFVSSNIDAAKALFPILLLCCTVSYAAIDSDSMASTSKGRRRSAARGSSLHIQSSSMQSCRMAVTNHFEQVLGSTSADPACSKMIIQALLKVRALRPVAEEPDKVCFWYDVDTTLLARRCIACGLYTASIFFVEHSMWGKDESQTTSTSPARSQTNLLHQAYMNIDDPDAFYGITDGDVRELLLKRLHHEGQWLRAFQYHAADYEAASLDGASSSSNAARGLGQSLALLGFKQLRDSIETGNPSSGLTVDRHDFGISLWDLPDSRGPMLSPSPAIERVLQTLRQANSEQDVDKPLSMAIQSHLQALCSTAAESIQQMRSLRGDLLALGQVKDWRKASASIGPEEAVADLRSRWTQPFEADHFEVAEKVLVTRQSVLESARIRMQSIQIGDILDGPAEQIAKVERSLLVLLSRQAREHQRLQKAINATARAGKIEAALGDGANLAREEFAAVLWDQNEHPPAMQLLSQIVDGLDTTAQPSVPQNRRAARLLSLLAQWRATARSQHPREIDQKLFEPALKLTTSSATSGITPQSANTDQSEIAYRWARFAEDNYRGSDMTEITRLQLYIDRRHEEIAQNQRECERTSHKTERNKLMQFQRQAEKILRQDQTRLKELEASRTHFLRRSTVMYARALAASDAHDDAVARLVSLWFEHAADAELNRLLGNSLAPIPSRKFVPLLHQLSARLTEVPTLHAEDGIALFQKNLFSLLLGMCQDHPFHCLYAIFALVKTGADAKAALDRPSPRGSHASSGSTSPSPSPQILRSTAAEKIWNHIKKRSDHGKRIRTFEELCLAYVEWAEYDLTSRPDRYFQSSGSIKKGALRMPPSGELRLSRMKDLDVPVATARLEIDTTCRYEAFVSIARYSETFTTAGGIHLPKISECIGSDRKRYKQLFKRDDDLRQDAVMQQVFRMVNELLYADRRTRERHLAIRTYTVLPLGPQCGMLEFVTNTMPLGEVLIALHSMYRPNDLTPTQARAKLRDAQPLPAEAKLEAFLDVCEAMRPAFRYFFSDAQRMPRDWYETRLRYTRSVSTNSIVGHILGLGDRHVSNILLDKESGELVHIDFGIAFDQGKLLPIPELVPFRLTRDIVDGMGVNGVEGTFRRCCEETLRVLRAHQDVIKTVLEVFRHDPLFAWTSNPIKVLRAQEADENLLAMVSEERPQRLTPAATPTPIRATTPLAVSGGQAKVVGTDTAELSADRAVASVMTKLSSSLSVEYTVNDLIQQAMDAGNLSAIFHGWQAAL